MGKSTPRVASSLEEFVREKVVPQFAYENHYAHIMVNFFKEEDASSRQCRVNFSYYVPNTFFRDSKDYATYEEAIVRGLADARDSLLAHLPADTEFAPNPLPKGRSHVQLRFSLKK